MILPVFQNTKSRLLLSTLCLSVALSSSFSSSFSSSLMASKNNLLGDNEEKILKRTRDTNNLNNTNLHNGEVDLTLEEERPLKNQKTEPASGAIVNAMPIQMGGIEVPNDIVSHFFFHTPISGIRAGRCVSKPLQQLLMSDDFCNYWGINFYPSAPKAMGMTPQEFIKYWSTPSFEIMDNILEIKGMSADGSTIVVLVDDKVTNMPNAVQWKNGKIEILQKNDETEVRPSRDGWGVTRAYTNANGSTIVSDAAYNNVTNKTMVVRWKNGEIEELPSLNNIEHTEVCGISAEGSTVVGLAMDSITRKFKAVQWKNGEIEELPSLKDFDEAKVCSISADGSTIVGYSGSMIKSTATLWTKNDVFSIQSLLEESEVTLEENHLASADLVSANGLLVLGRCDHPWSNRYFKAILPSKYSQ